MWMEHKDIVLVRVQVTCLDQAGGEVVGQVLPQAKPWGGGEGQGGRGGGRDYRPSLAGVAGHTTGQGLDTHVCPSQGPSGGTHVYHRRRHRPIHHQDPAPPPTHTHMCTMHVAVARMCMGGSNQGKTQHQQHTGHPPLPQGVRPNLVIVYISPEGPTWTLHQVHTHRYTHR